MGIKLVSIDIETTGLDPSTCDIIEFGAVLDEFVVGQELKPIEELPRFHCYILPPEGNIYKGEPYALSMHSTIFRRIAERDQQKNKQYKFVSPHKLGNMFKNFLVENGYKKENDRVVINVAGKNFASFDLQFLNMKTDLKKHVEIRHRIIDPAILFINSDDEKLPDTRVCKMRAGLDETVSHNSIDDAIDIIKLVRKALENKLLGVKVWKG